MLSPFGVTISEIIAYLGTQCARMHPAAPVMRAAMAVARGQGVGLDKGVTGSHQLCDSQNIAAMISAFNQTSYISFRIRDTRLRTLCRYEVQPHMYVKNCNL